MLQLNDVTLIFGQKLLFSDTTLSCKRRHRYAIVGANGCGKSSLLKLISKSELPTEGQIVLSSDARVGWLRQDQFIDDEYRVLDVVLRGRAELWAVLEQKQELLKKETLSNNDGYRLAELELKVADLDGYTAESVAESLLLGLGIAETYHNGPIKRLSGGMKLRVLLAQALFENPDVLLLDEPTNHLDLMTIAWLEHYLVSSFEGVLLFVSHDRDFINQVATDIVDIDYGEVRLYPHATYDAFLEQKVLIEEQKKQERTQAEKKIAHMQSFVDRFRAKATKAKQAQARLKMIDKIELPDLKQSSRIAPTISFSCQRPSGKQVVEVKELAKAFGEKTLFSDISFSINRGEKVALIGHNGVGKSTLLKIVLSELAADFGEVKWGHEVSVGYFSQDHHESLDPDKNKGVKTVLDWLSHEAPVPATAVRKTLGCMLFRQTEAEKNLHNLSGGEAARLLLAKLILLQNNMLILDEPTNHLDLEAINALADALKAYRGTVLFVSHNRHFVSQLATRVIALTEEGVTDVVGSYDDFIDVYGDDYLSKSWLAIQK